MLVNRGSGGVAGSAVLVLVLVLVVTCLKTHATSRLTRALNSSDRAVRISLERDSVVLQNCATTQA